MCLVVVARFLPTVGTGLFRPSVSSRWRPHRRVLPTDGPSPWEMFVVPRCWGEVVTGYCLLVTCNGSDFVSARLPKRACTTRRERRRCRREKGGGWSLIWVAAGVVVILHLRYAASGLIPVDARVQGISVGVYVGGVWVESCSTSFGSNCCLQTLLSHVTNFSTEETEIVVKTVLPFLWCQFTVLSQFWSKVGVVLGLSRSSSGGTHHQGVWALFIRTWIWRCRGLVSSVLWFGRCSFPSNVSTLTHGP